MHLSPRTCKQYDFIEWREWVIVRILPKKKIIYMYCPTVLTQNGNSKIICFFRLPLNSIFFVWWSHPPHSCFFNPEYIECFLSLLLITGVSYFSSHPVRTELFFPQTISVPVLQV